MNRDVVEPQVAQVNEATGAAWHGHALQRWQLDGVRLPLDVMTTLLALSLWMACGSLFLAVADGLGGHPVRRAAIGGLLVLACVVALWRRRAVCAALWERPWLVLPLAMGELGLAAVDGLVSSPYAAFSLTSIGIAVAAARARTVWLCVVLLAVGYLVLAMIASPGAGFASGGRTGTVLGAVVGYVAAAVPPMLLRQRFERLTAGCNSPATLTPAEPWTTVACLLSQAPPSRLTH